MKKLFIIFLLLFIGNTNIFANNNELSILDIDSTNSNLLKIFVDNEIEAKDNKLTSDLKLFKDLAIENISRDLEDNKKIDLVLKEELEKNTFYSLLPIIGVDGNIDFKIGDLINGLEINGTELDGIEKLTILDSKHINILFTKDIVSNEIEIKILKEYNISSIILNSDNKKEIDVTLSSSFKNNTSYLLMMFSVSNSDNLEYTIKNYIYDFNTDQLLTNEIVNINDDKILKETKMNNVAFNSANTPNTGPETGILILFTFILSSIVYFRKKA